MAASRVLVALTTALIVALVADPAAGRSEVTNVSVAMTEFKFALSKRTVPRGPVAFRLMNRGDAAHDIKVNGRTSPIYKPGKSGIFRVTFARAGRYPYVCTLPGHAQAGMKGVLIVR